jgi:hypothetical protein
VQEIRFHNVCYVQYRMRYRSVALSTLQITRIVYCMFIYKKKVHLYTRGGAHPSGNKSKPYDVFTDINLYTGIGVPYMFIYTRKKLSTVLIFFFPLAFFFYVFFAHPPPPHSPRPLLYSFLLSVFLFPSLHIYTRTTYIHYAFTYGAAAATAVRAKVQYGERSIKRQPVYLELLSSLVYVRGIYRRRSFGRRENVSRRARIDPPAPVSSGRRALDPSTDKATGPGPPRLDRRILHTPPHQPPHKPRTDVTNLKPCRNLYLFAPNSHLHTHTRAHVHIIRAQTPRTYAPAAPLSHTI